VAPIYRCRRIQGRGAAFSNGDKSDIGDRKGEQDQRLRAIAEEEVKHRRNQKELQYRFAQDFDRDVNEH
jgi:hypothetical protein